MKTVLKRTGALLMIFALVLSATPDLVITAPGFSTEPMIAAGDGHIVALSGDGTVWAWGYNMYGQLGDGTGGTQEWGDYSNTPVRVQNLTNVIAVSAGRNNSAALRSDGTVWTWGCNMSGQLGIGTRFDLSTVPVQVHGLTNVIAIAAGNFHMLALRNDGTVWAWGANYDGALGDGTFTGRCDISNEFLENHRLTPVRVHNISNAIAISASSESVAVLDNGTVMRWGRYGVDAEYLEELMSVTTFVTTPVQASGHNNVSDIVVGSITTISLRDSGTVWKGLDSPVQVQNINNATAIAASGSATSGGSFQFTSLALRSDGTVLQWDGMGDLWDASVNVTTAPSQVQGLSSIMSIATSTTNMEAMLTAYAAALRTDGTVWVWGTRVPGLEEWEQSTPVQVPGLGGIGNLNLLGTFVQEPAPQEPIPSIPNNHSSWAGEELHRAAELGLIPTTLQGANVDLTLPISREEFAGVIVMTFENLAHTVALPTIVNPFTDTRDTYVLRAFNIGLMVGISDTRFDPHTLLTREQAATALTRAFKRATIPSWTFATDANYPLDFVWPAPFADDAYISSWARESVYFMVANGIIQGTGSNRFSPRAVTSAQQAIGYASATREQAIIIALRMIENLG